MVADAAHWSEISLNIGDQYFLEVPESQVEVAYYSYDSTNPYAGGEIWHGALMFNYGGGFDLTFRTYASESGNVPESATLALFGLGLAGLGWSRRKKA